MMAKLTANMVPDMESSWVPYVVPNMWYQKPHTMFNAVFPIEYCIQYGKHHQST